MGNVDLVLCIHSHQPVGNFHAVFEQAYRDAYAPFIDLVERHPKIRFSAHYSGSLLEWLAEYRADFLDRLRALVDQGRLELLGGGMYEPVFPLLTEEDARGQIEMMTDFLRENLGVVPTGMWIPERVWEPHLASWFARAGMEYSVLDDLHFRAAGVPGENLNRAFLTEDRGEIFRLFPGREELRYAIPFRDPEWTVNYLRSFPEGSVLVYADDGEKFGLWPETRKHCYEDGWLERFFTALDDAPDIRLRTLSEAIRERPPEDRVYLPTCSYREMGEWSYPSRCQKEFEAWQEELRASGRFEEVNHFLTGGSWRNFRVKYPEVHQMYARMTSVSKRIAAATPARREAARRDLYKAQCNCGWWHGIFGGLYLPHLRSVIHRHLLSAEEAVRGDSLLGWHRGDFDLDGWEDLEVYNREYRLWLVPERGARMVECDLRRSRLNLTAGLSRRYEVSHDRPSPEEDPEGEAKSIHDAVNQQNAIDPTDLEYDRYTHASLVDHFFSYDISPGDVLSGKMERGDFVGGRYEYSCRNEGGQVVVTFSRRGDVGGQEVLLEKVVVLERGSSLFTVQHRIRNRSREPLHRIFASEYLFAVVAKGGVLHHGNGKSVGNPGEAGTYKTQFPLWVRDPTQGVEIGLHASGPTGYWVLPLHTVSLSETGLQKTHQGTVVMPWWTLHIAPGKEWSGVTTHDVRVLL